MSWIISGSEKFDPDAQSYIGRVESADQDNLEPAVKSAINEFVVGCKSDGIWDSISATCILSGAKTLNGALIALKGPDPTNYGPFTQSDYNRKTGIIGDELTKYLDTNVYHESLPPLSKHTSVYVSQVSGSGSFMGWRAGSQWLMYPLSVFMPGPTVGWPTTFTAPTFGFVQINGTSFQSRCNGLNKTVQGTYVGTSTSITWTVLERNLSPLKGAHRVSFYSVGQALDSSLLDSRVTILLNSFAANIP